VILTIVNNLKEGFKMNTMEDKLKDDYKFAALSPGELQDLKAIEEKINQEKSQQIILLAYEKNK
jgi:hypothetical protein